MDQARAVFTSGSLISEGVSLVSYIDEIQEKCDLNLENLACVVRNFPFFMEGERHIYMRQRILKHIGINSKLKPWEAYIDESLNSALNKLEGKGEVDLLSDFINPFLQETTCTILGILTKDPQKFEQCASLAESLLNPLLPIRVLKKMEASFTDFFEEILSKERPIREDGNVPLLSELMKEPISGYSRKDISAFVLVVYAGTIALKYTLANIIFRILSGNESVKKKAASPEWIQSNLDHLIRESVAVKRVSRVSKENCEVGNLMVDQGDTLVIDMQAIHHGADSGCPLHKENKWDNETLRKNTHLAFGKGSHYCLGANYSKFIFEKILPAIFTKYPDIQLIDRSPELINHTQMLAVKTLICQIGST
jgi:cytochrome P450